MRGKRLVHRPCFNSLPLQFSFLISIPYLQCLPEGRQWPGQKCQRCLRHKPELDCSAPTENNRKRGPSKKQAHSTKRSNTGTGTTPERQDAQASADDDHSAIEEAPAPREFYRPARYTIPNPAKKESPDPESLQAAKTTRESDRRPAAAYIPLGEDQIRLLRVDLTFKRDKRIICEFVQVSLTQAMNQQYEAISYFWGGHNQKSTQIILRDRAGKSHAMYVVNNVHNAMREICHPTEPHLYWIDALCINHHDKKEQSRQVGLKRFIFHHAQNMCFWLGQDDISIKGLKFVTQILDLTRIDQLARDPIAIHDWVAFVGLLKNTVFSRLWLVQEVVVASNVTLHCNRTTIAQYGDLVEAVAVFFSMRDSISQLFRQCRGSCRELTDRKMLMAEQFIDISVNAWRVPQKGGQIQRLLTLEELVSKLSDFTSSNPRDRIFSLLAIAKDGLQLNIHTLEGTADTQKPGALNIDYEKPLKIVYQDFVAHAIDESKSLDIICRRWVSSVPDDLPTWVRPLQTSQPISATKIEELTRADNLVGHPLRAPYSASGKTSAEHKIGLPNTPTANYLTAAGFIIEKISTLGVPALEGNIPNQWLEHGRCLPRDGIGRENFWRLLVADRGPNGSNAPSWYRLAFLYCLEHLNYDGNINTEQLILLCEPEVDAKEIKEEGQGHASRGDSSLIVDFLRRVQSVVWNRKLLVFKEDQTEAQLPTMGLVPMATEVDDLLCVLYGCSVPVVLRRSRDEKDGVERYLLVGECYVGKNMDGEAMDRFREGRPEDKQEGKYQKTKFQIR